MSRHIGEMIRKVFVVGILASGMVLVGVQPGNRHRIAVSAQNFQQSFRDLNAAGNSLSPLERFVFSLVLASTNASQTAGAVNGD